MRTESEERVVADDFTSWIRPHWDRMDRLARRLVGNGAAEDVSPRRTDAHDLTAALMRLTERRRVAVALHYYLGLSVDECAAAMSCSSGTVKSTLFDARAQLRTILGEEYR